MQRLSFWLHRFPNLQHMSPERSMGCFAFELSTEMCQYISRLSVRALEIDIYVFDSLGDGLLQPGSLSSISSCVIGRSFVARAEPSFIQRMLNAITTAAPNMHTLEVHVKAGWTFEMLDAIGSTQLVQGAHSNSLKTVCVNFHVCGADDWRTERHACMGRWGALEVKHRSARSMVKTVAGAAIAVCFHEPE
jgi:hypothetical protein